jgi:hypothetical protein
MSLIVRLILLTVFSMTMLTFARSSLSARSVSSVPTRSSGTSSL